MISEYVLTICIPTYNRVDLLKETLDNLINQIIKTKCKIEICVSDNCSTDGTANLLKTYENKYFFVKININKFNCGYDFNLCTAINMATGTYIWTLSDDDLVLHYSIEYIMSLMRKYIDNNISTIFLRPEFVIKDFIYDVADNIAIENNKLTEIVYEDPDNALMKVNWLVSFLSAFVLRRELISDNFSRFFGNGFIHTPMILDCVKKGNVIVSNDVHLLCRQSNSGGYNIYKYFGTNIMEIFHFYSFKQQFCKETIDMVVTEWLKECVRGNVIHVKLSSDESVKSINRISDLIFPYINNIYFIKKILPILIMPKTIIKAILKLRKMLN